MLLNYIVSLKLLYRAILLCGLALFFASQSLTLAHASSCGSDTHDHEGKVCTLMVLSDEQDVTIRPIVPLLHSFTAYTSPIYTDVFTSTPYASPQERAPPPRAPPLIIQ